MKRQWINRTTKNVFKLHKILFCFPLDKDAYERYKYLNLPDSLSDTLGRAVTDTTATANNVHRNPATLIFININITLLQVKKKKVFKNVHK